MDEVSLHIIDRETALANFDHARDDFERVLDLVPDEALEYKPEGDDYSIADLVPHVTGSINDYARQLDLMREMEFREVRLVAASEGATLIEQGRREREDTTPQEGHTNALAEMEAAHDSLAAKLRELADEEYARQAPIIYQGSTEPYPTRAADIVGWLIDHYYEHVKQIQDMLEALRQEHKT